MMGSDVKVFEKFLKSFPRWILVGNYIVFASVFCLVLILVNMFQSSEIEYIPAYVKNINDDIVTLEIRMDEKNSGLMLQDCKEITIFVNKENKVEATVIKDVQCDNVLVLDILLLEQDEFVMSDNSFVQLAFKTGFNAFEEYVVERIKYKL